MRRRFAVPIEIVFNQGFGGSFGRHIAGNETANENIGSLEFGTAVPGANVLCVLGYTSSGAVTAALKGDEVHRDKSANCSSTCVPP